MYAHFANEFSMLIMYRYSMMLQLSSATIRERQFVDTFGADLKEAYDRLVDAILQLP
jgi:hypothetical protein